MPSIKKASNTGILKEWYSRDAEAAQAWMADNTVSAGVRNSVLNGGDE